VFSEVDQAIELCREHLDRTNSTATEIEAFLVRYLLVLIVAKFEAAVRSGLIAEIKANARARVAAFAVSSVDNVLRSIKLGELSGVLNKFEPELGAIFSDGISRIPQAKNAYDNILNNRRTVAHDLGLVQLTFRELCENYADSKAVVENFIRVLNGS